MFKSWSGRTVPQGVHVLKVSCQRHNCTLRGVVVLCIVQMPGQASDVEVLQEFCGGILSTVGVCALSDCALSTQTTVERSTVMCPRGQTVPKVNAP